MSGTNKLKILCLHGMVQNGTVFRKKTAVLRKKLDKIADLGKTMNQMKQSNTQWITNRVILSLPQRNKY